MTPQEKAFELVTKYKPLVTTWDCYWDTPRNPDGVKEDAKQCALIAVEEIIKSNPIIPLTYMLESEAIDAGIEYWNDVKSEIEKL